MLRIVEDTYKEGTHDLQRGTCNALRWKELERRSPEVMEKWKATPNDHSAIECRACGSERGNGPPCWWRAPARTPMVGRKLMDVLIYENYAEKKRPGRRSSVKN